MRMRFLRLGRNLLITFKTIVLGTYLGTKSDFATWYPELLVPRC